MKKEFKNKNKIISVVLTFVLIVLVSSSVGKVVQNKFSVMYMLDRQNIWNFYEMPKNSIDVFITGSSQIVSGVSAPELYNEYGIAACSVSTCSQPVRAARYWLSEMLRTQSPKVFIYEISGLYYKDKDKVSHARAFTDMKNTSLNKYQGLKELTDGDTEEMLSYYWQLYGYHNRWSELEKNDYVFDDGVYRDSFLGFSVINTAYKNQNSRNDYVVSYTENGKKEVTEETYLRYLKEMKEICDEEGITMIFLKTPRTDWSDEEYSAIKDLADSMGVEYLDLNYTENFDALKLDYATDLMDYKHMNLHGARKVTSFIGKYLTENFTFEDERTKKRSHIREVYEAYCEGVKTSELPYIEKFSDLGEFMDNKNYSFTLAKSGNVEFTEGDLEVLKLMGAKKDVTEKKNYVLIRNGGRVIEEQQSDGSIVLRGFTLKGDYYRGVTDKNGITTKFADASKTSKNEAAVVISIFDKSTGLKAATFVFDATLSVI